MSSLEADFAWQGGSWIPQATQSTQTLLLPTSFVTFWSTMVRAQHGAQPGQIPLWGGLNLSSSMVIDAATASAQPSVSSYFSLALLPSSLCILSSSLDSGLFSLCLLDLTRT